jgi:hypothetical protein
VQPELHQPALPGLDCTAARWRHPDASSDGFSGMRKSTMMPHDHPRPRTAMPASIARRRRPHHREFPIGYSLAGCSPAEPASASPAAAVYVHRPLRGNHHRCSHFFSTMRSISRSRNQQTACHSRAPSRQSSETKHEGRDPFLPWAPAFRRCGRIFDVSLDPPLPTESPEWV